MSELSEAVSDIRKNTWGFRHESDSFLKSISDSEAAEFCKVVEGKSIYIDDEYFYSNVEVALRCFIYGLRSQFERGLSGQIDNLIPARPLRKSSGTIEGEGATCSLCFYYHDGEKWEAM